MKGLPIFMSSWSIIIIIIIIILFSNPIVLVPATRVLEATIIYEIQELGQYAAAAKDVSDCAYIRP